MAKILDYRGESNVPIVIEDPRATNDGFYLYGEKYDKNTLAPELNKKIKEFSRLSTQEKIFKYKFSPDRADVIDHALHIFKFISEHLMVERITSTRWGVSDSIGVKLFHEIYSNKINIS